MRGKASISTSVGVVVWITPAYAGKSFDSRIAAHRQQDHPRVCGEKLANGIAFGDRGGSPPRMRGKGVFGGLTYGDKGITPAYAGKS